MSVTPLHFSPFLHHYFSVSSFTMRLKQRAIQKKYNVTYKLYITFNFLVTPFKKVKTQKGCEIVFNIMLFNLNIFKNIISTCSQSK